MAQITATGLLDFEAGWQTHSSSKEIAIRSDLGLNPARFYQLLSRAARSMEGIRHDAVTCRRVRELERDPRSSPVITE